MVNDSAGSEVSRCVWVERVQPHSVDGPLVGKTVVLGSARPDPDDPTIILTVRPEFVAAELQEEAEGERG